MSAIIAARPEQPQPEQPQPDAPDTQALIAEARAHARRRRLKLAIVLAVAAVLAVAGVLIGRAVTRSHPGTAAGQRPAVLAAATGIVTGHLAACFGLPPRAGQLPVTPGTVFALRGTVTWKHTGPGSWQAMFPSGPAVASEHISNNYDQTFRFALPPGHYVLAGRYQGAGSTYGPFRNVTVTAGATIRVDLPNVCS